MQSGGDPRPSLIGNQQNVCEPKPLISSKFLLPAVFTPYPCMESTLQGGIEAMVIPIGSVAG